RSSISCGPGHGVSRSCSCSDSRRDGCLGADTNRRSSPTTHGAISTSVHAHASCGRIRSPATAISSTQRARVPHNACISSARLRGSIAHQVLFRCYSGLPKELGADRVDADRVDDAVAYLRRCLDEAVEGVRMELTELQQRELLHGLWRDLEAFVREDAAAEP